MIHLNGIDLHYEVHGSGEPLLLLHGWLQSSRNWQDYIDAYASQFEVYVIDLRGHGRSTPLTTEFSIKKASHDIQLFIENMGLENVNLIGFSFGGMLCLELANQNKVKLAAMVLIGTPYNYNGKDSSELAENFGYDRLPESFKQGLRELHPQGEAQIRALFNPDLDYEIRISPDELKVLNVKTMVISGEKDEIFGIHVAHDLHKYLPDSKLWILEGAGHNPFTSENKTAILQQTIDFLCNEK